MRLRWPWMFAFVVWVAAPLLMAGGKNKVNYESFDWKIYQSQHFKFYFYSAEEHLLENMVDLSEAAYKVVSEKLQHQIDFPIPMVLFKTHEEFMQNNVNPGFLPQGVQAFADPYQSRMVLPIDGTPEFLFALTTHELTHIFQYDMLYNNKISTIIRANSPIWFREGMASWVADDEDNLDRMVLRDVAVNGGFLSLANFEGFSFISYRVGHAAFEFMEERYGIEGVRNFLWQYRKNITGNVGAAIERAFETDIAEFDRDFRKYLRKRYVALMPVKEEPDDFSREIRTRKSITTLSPELSPSGDLFAAIIPHKNEMDLVLISTKDGRIFRNLTRGRTHRYQELSINSFRGVNDLSWSADGNKIAFSAREEGTHHIMVTNVLNGKIIYDLVFNNIRDAQSPIFSKDGSHLYFAGNRNGFYDIFKYNLETKILENVTNDEYQNRNPRLSPDGKNMLYSSMRNGFFKIYDLELASGEKTQLTSGLGNDIQASYSQDMSSIYFSSDRFDDIYNIYELELETGEKKQYTNILTGAFSPQERVTFNHKEGVETKQLVFTSYYQGRYRVYRMDKPEDRAAIYEDNQDNYTNVKNYDMTANVKLDPRRFRKYKLTKNFSIHGAQVNVGATSDGRFISNSSVAFSDTVGNRQLTFNGFSVSNYETYNIGYQDRSRRWVWGGYVKLEQSFYIDPIQRQISGPNAPRDERTYKVNEGGLMYEYPFNFNSRVSLTAGITDQDRWNYKFDEETDSLSIASVDYTEPFATLSFSWDSVAYAAYGPQHGTVFDMYVREEFNQNTSYSMDMRTYREITRRSLLAFRVIGNYSDGDTPSVYALGGNDALRGDYDYQEFLGSRRVLTQMEWRFPLVDVLRLPGGVGFGNIRGSLFVDVGGSWFNDDKFEWDFQPALPGDLQTAVDNGTPQEIVDPDNEFFNPALPSSDFLIGAYGFQVSMNLLGMDVHWTWSKRTNFDSSSDSLLSFWIGRNF